MPSSFNDPVYSSVPTLLISGSDDPATPPRYASEELPYLHRANKCSSAIKRRCDGRAGGVNPAPEILHGVSAQTAGILLGIFSIFASLVVFWGAYAEQNRTNRDARAYRPNPSGEKIRTTGARDYSSKA